MDGWTTPSAGGVVDYLTSPFIYDPGDLLTTVESELVSRAGGCRVQIFWITRDWKDACVAERRAPGFGGFGGPQGLVAGTRGRPSRAMAGTIKCRVLRGHTRGIYITRSRVTCHMPKVYPFPFATSTPILRLCGFALCPLDLWPRASDDYPLHLLPCGPVDRPPYPWPFWIC